MPLPSPPTAVVVNDDLTQLNVLAGLLRKAGLTPQAFSDAEAALQFMLETAPPALIVTDLYMPNLDGWRFCHLLRSAEYPTLNAVPIMVVSATFAGEESHRITADVGASLFMPAPVDGPLFIRQARMLVAGELPQVRPRVLILEDSATLTGLLRKTLTAHGYQPDTATRLADGLQMFKQANYDLAVLDYHLPDGQGDRILDWFQANQPNCVCIMTTSDPHPHLALDWMKRGAAAYLRKPFAMDYLLEVVERSRRERALLRVEDLLETRTARLRESEARLNLALQVAQLGYWIYDCETGQVDWSDDHDKLFGISMEAFGGTLDAVQECVHPEDREQGVQNLRKTLEQDVPFDNTYRVIHPDGSIHWLHSFGYLSRNQQGQPLHIFGTTQDITASKQAEDTLRVSEARFRKLLQNVVHVSVQGYDINGVVTYWNKASERLYGYSDEEALGHNLLDLIIPETIREDVRLHIQQMYTSGQSGPAEELLLKRRDGSLVPVFSNHVVVNLSETKKELYCIDIDLSEVKRAEAERENLQAQLIQAQKMESIGALAGGVAHDFNNMLSVVMGHAELAMLETEPDAPLWRRLKQIMEVSRRSTDMVRQLLAFARKQIIAPRVLTLNDTVEDMLNMLRQLIGEHIHLVWRPGPEIWQVKLDPAQIDQILVNLCVNARDAIADTGNITIETQAVSLNDAYCTRHLGCKPGDYVLLSITDSGSGISPESLTHIFDPFYTTKEVGRGTGLGLATVYGIIKQNQGYIMVYSELHHGTCFKIYLPRHLEAVSEKTVREASTPLSGGHETILLVEDNEALLEMGVMMLKTLGYQVISAAAPQEALGLAETHCGAIDLLITDVILPEMNGQKLASLLTARFPRLRCLFMSGYTSDIISEQGALNDGVQFIQKPFSLRQLAAKVREVVEG